VNVRVIGHDHAPLTLVADRLNLYAGTVHHVHDGDTVYCLLWSPLEQHYVLTGCRIRGVQAPELGKDPGAEEVRDFLKARLPVGEQVVVHDVGAYPRAAHITCSLTAADGTDITTWLLERGYAVAWNGQGKKPAVPWPPSTPGATLP
jgi:endonuclease YncB( thermonuclease family)